MHTYLTNILITLKLMGRDRMAMFFGYVFPLLFFFLFAQMMSAGQGGDVAKQVVANVLIFGVLGNGFFGAGMRAVSDRENNILRRFKVAPTNAAPLLVGWLVTGWINYIPSAIFLILIGRIGYQMPWPERPLDLFLFLSLAVLAFRAIGLIIASVVNGMQESQILIQLMYLPMLFLSGATFPISAMPNWLQITAQFIPSAHLFTGLQGILLRQQSFPMQTKAVIALLLTLALGLFISVKLFRWEKEQKVKAAAKLWVLAVLAPFFVLGIWEAQSKENLTQAKILQRTLRRGRSVVIRDVRIFLGDGRVIERGGVLVAKGKIERVFEGDTPDPKTLNADPVEGSGKTLLPGFVDTGVYLSWPGGIPSQESYSKTDKALEHSLKAYLFSGVTAVRSLGDSAAEMAKLRGRIESGELLGPDLVYTGPTFTTKAALTEGPLRNIPEAFRERVAQSVLRMPADAGEAERAVADLAAQHAQALHVDMARLSPELVGVIERAARAKGLAVVASVETNAAPAADLLDSTMVQQVAPKGMIERTKPILAAISSKEPPAAVATNITSIVSRSGQTFLIHGPAIHRVMAHLVRSGMAPADALRAATLGGAEALGLSARVGRIQPGFDANLVLVDGNPVKDITVTERLSMVMLRGERLLRGALFEDEEEDK
jgi:ABC-type multidrug transport system permease subunit